MDLKGLLEKVLRGMVGSPGLEVHEVNEVPCTKPGDNYMSVVSAVEVTGSVPGGTAYSGSFFIKRPLESADRRQELMVEEAFDNEALMYLRVLPLYAVTVSTPVCYHADSDVILLQDLRREGYSMIDRAEGYDLYTAKLILKALANFHAASYHTIVTKKEEFQEVISLLKPIGLPLSRNSGVVEISLRRAIRQLAGVEDLENVLPVLHSLQGLVRDTLVDLRRAKEVSVLCHGDFWINNILLHTASEDPVRIVDLQACAVESPAVDVWTLLYTSVHPDLLKEHLDQLLQFYCNSFLDDVAKLKVPPHLIPCSSNLLKELESKELYGFLAATNYLPVVFFSPDSSPDLDALTPEQASDDSFLDRFITPGFGERIRHLVRFGKKRGIFN